MPNNYTYVDPEYSYTDPQTGLLRNMGNIADTGALQFAETGAFMQYSQKLLLDLIKQFSKECVQ